ncbi:hypothetical protein AYO47_00635 [Planctomyces sp. SCGC AG-212-M04]|nr:hypothetical protein AYO47_00635 [Planctomyces sp. SCGC AG-212-M04]
MLLSLLAVASTAAAQSSAVEHFNRDPGWEGRFNRTELTNLPEVVQDFGYSQSNHAGTAGEMGGRIQRTARPAYYAAELAPVSLNDRLSASGTFAITDCQPGAGVYFGFFNSKQPGGSGRPIGSLGLDFDFEGSGGRLAVRLITNTNRSCGTFITPYVPGHFRPTPLRKDGTRYRWTLDYDPEAAKGRGQFTFTIDSDTHTSQDYGQLDGRARKEADVRFPVARKFVVELPIGLKYEGATFDRFGLMNMMKNGGAATIFFDDLKWNGQTQDFSKDPGWKGSGNRNQYQDRELVGAHDFGWSAETNHAGGRTGEIGGSLWRSGKPAWYAAKVEPFTKVQRLEARGKAQLVTAGPDSDMYIGWFSERAEGSPADAGAFIGVHVGGPTRIGHYFMPRIVDAKGERLMLDSAPIMSLGKAQEWSIVYEPAAEGPGTMTVTLDGKTAVMKVPANRAPALESLNRFGLCTSSIGGQAVKIYFDDVEATGLPK